MILRNPGVDIKGFNASSSEKLDFLKDETKSFSDSTAALLLKRFGFLVLEGSEDVPVAPSVSMDAELDEEVGSKVAEEAKIPPEIAELVQCPECSKEIKVRGLAMHRGRFHKSV